MRLLKRSDTGEFEFTKPFADDETIPPYAILSHTWLEDAQEPTFEDLSNGTGGEKLGYEKIRFCAEQAKCDGLQYVWVDTCCIDKSNHAELSRAINLMFCWYRNAARCYVYLSDLHSPLDSDLGRSRWFSRGWTLQELLAPRSIEFFSCERTRIGDRNSLKRQIEQITGIPVSALQGPGLSQFNGDDCFLWMERRQTKLAEDQVYSLLGILDIKIPLYYGEGAGNAYNRVQEVINKRKRCIQDLRLTDPWDDKKRIEETKGGLLVDSYCWILNNSEFQRWRNGSHPLLWIKGDPGKGKTMLLCGIINELNKLNAGTFILTYFFCQATDSNINNATAVLRGLIYGLVCQQPSLVWHMQKKHDYAGKTLFEDANAWVALSNIFRDILQDPSLNSIYLVVDALDECITGLPKLLDLIVEILPVSRIKWIISSRNWPDIEERLERAGNKVRLSLELNADSIAAAVRSYIRYKVSQLAHKKKYNDQMKGAVISYLDTNAYETFLWVALVCQNLDKTSRFSLDTKLKAFPPGLYALYERMMQHVHESDDADLCKRVLATVAIVYQPITLQELTSLVEELDGMADDLELLQELIDRCGSFLTIRDGIIYFVHQSAKDFLLKEAFDTVFPSGSEEVYYTVFSRSVLALSNTLYRNMYRLYSLGCPIEQAQKPNPDPLEASRYSCIYWIDHLCDWSSEPSSHGGDVLQSGGTVDSFLRKKYLYWLEALSLCKSMSKGLTSMARLEGLLQERTHASPLNELVRDARRFIMAYKLAIQNSPLQVYASALLFSPTQSLIRDLFKKEELDWIIIKPGMEAKWSSCLLTLEDHGDRVNSAAFSHDSTRLASGSWDKKVKVWDADSGECLSTLEGHSDRVMSVAFSHDSTRLASASWDKTVKVWDTSSGECLLTLEGHNNEVNSVAFSHNSTRLASASGDYTVKVWDTNSGECLLTLEGHYHLVISVAFSHDSTQLASASSHRTVKIWDAGSGECLSTLWGHGYRIGHGISVCSVAYSHDSTLLASASMDGTVKIWDAISSKCLLTLEGHDICVYSVAFSHDSTRLASGSWDNTVKVWDTGSGKCLSTIEGHSDRVMSVAFSHDSTRLVSASWDETVKVLDANSGECLSTLNGHSLQVNSVAFSHDSNRMASASWDQTVKVWDASSGECLTTLEDHSDNVKLVAFSHDSTRLVSVSDNNAVRVWNAGSGECLSALQGHTDSINSVTFSHNSTRLASALHNKMVKVWDANSGECLLTLEGHSDAIHSVAFSYNSTWLASASDDKTVKVWDAGSGECLLTLRGHSNVIRSVAFSHDSTRLASASYDETIKVWDACSGECLLTLEGHRSEVQSVAFSHDSTRLASASWDMTVKVWDAGSGECLSTLEGHSSAVNSVAFSHDSNRLASASWDNTVKVWDAGSGECLLTLVGHTHTVLSVAFCHNSTQIVSASDDKTIKVWDIDNGECLSTLEGHSDAVNSATFSHNSTRLASASEDKTVKIWDAGSGECLLTIGGHCSDINSVAFSHDSTQLVSASDDKTIKVWDIDSGECLSTLEGHSDAVNSATFSHDSTQLASVSNDQTIKVWDAGNGELLSTLEGHSGAVNSVAFSHGSTRLASASYDQKVKVWDIDSGECLLTLQVGMKIHINSFALNSHLLTNVGIINISDQLSSRPFLGNLEPQNPQYQGLGLSADRMWLTHKSENLLWLPSEYRPSCSAALGNSIAIGVGNGKVWICKVQGNTS